MIHPIVAIPGELQIIGEFNGNGDIISVPDGSGFSGLPGGGPVLTSMVSRSIHPSHRAYIESLRLAIVDLAAFDQIYFALRLNGLNIPPWDFVSSEQILLYPFIPVGKIVDPGLLEIVAYSKAGTTQPGASGVLGGVRCQAAWVGYAVRSRHGSQY